MSSDFAYLRQTVVSVWPDLLYHHFICSRQILPGSVQIAAKGGAHYHYRYEPLYSGWAQGEVSAVIKKHPEENITQSMSMYELCVVCVFCVPIFTNKSMKVTSGTLMPSERFQVRELYFLRPQAKGC